jgi:LacI family transcriptional regulator
MSMKRTTRRRTAEAPPQEQGVTLANVAQEAGVSPSTVSRILNGTARVREAKVEAVRRAIAKLQFSPNAVARSLAGGRSMSIGVVVQAIDGPFYGEALAAIERGLSRSGYSALFASGHWRADDERRCIEQLVGRRVDGMILMTSCLPDAELQTLARGMPLVLTGRSVEGTRIHCIDTDSTPGAQLVTEYLIGLGHTHIACISGPADHPDAAQRLAGYREALRRHQLDAPRQLVESADYTDAGGYQAMSRLLECGMPFTAVFASNDQMAYGAMLAAHRRGLQVPRDVSVVGYDDLQTSAFTLPPLTTVHRGISDIGQCAAEAVVDLIDGRSPRTREPAATLALRESTRLQR